MIMSTENDTYTICVVFERLLNEISLHIDRGISNASIDSNSNNRNDANIINTMDKDNKDKGVNDADVKLWADLEQLLSSLSSDTLKLLVVKNSSFLNILCYYASVNNYRRNKITWSHSLKCLLLIYSSYDITMLWQYIDYSADELLSNFFEVYEVISQRYIASSISHHEYCTHSVQCIHAMSKLLNDCDIYNLAAYKPFLDMLSRFMSAFYDSNEQRGTYSGKTFNKLLQSHTFMYTNKVRQCLIITREQELMGQSMVSTTNGQHSNLYSKPLVNNKECFDFLLELMVTLCLNKDLLSFPIVVLTMMRSHASISLIPLFSVGDKQLMRKVDQLHKVIGDLLRRLGNAMLLLQAPSPPGMDHHPLISTRGDFIAPLVSIMCSYNPICRHSAQFCLYILIHNHSPPLQTTSPSSCPIDIKMILNSTPAMMIKYGSSIVNGLLKVVGDVKNLDLLNSDSPSVDLCKNIDEIIAHTLDFLISRHHAHSFDGIDGSSVKHDDEKNFDDGDSAMLMAFKDIVSELLSRMSDVRSRPRLIETLELGLQLGVTAGIRGCDQLLHANKSFLRPAIHITAMRSDGGHVYVSSEKEHIPASASSRHGSSQLYTASSIRADSLSSSSSSSSSAIMQRPTSAAIRSADVSRPSHQVWSIFKPSSSEINNNNNENNKTSAGTLHHTSSSFLPTKHHPNSSNGHVSSSSLKRKHESSSSNGHGDSAFNRLHRLENAYNEKERKNLLKNRFFGGGQQQQQQQQYNSYDEAANENDDDKDKDEKEEEELNFQAYGHEYRSKTGRGYPQSAHLSLSSYSRAPAEQIAHSSSSSSSSLKGDEEGVWRSKMKELREAKEAARQSRRPQQQQRQMDGGDETTSHRQLPYRNGNSNYLDEGNDDDDDGTTNPHPIDRSGNGNDYGSSSKDAENTKHKTVNWRDFIIPADSSSSSGGGKKVTADNGHQRYGGNDIRMHSANLDKLLKAYLSSTNSDAVGGKNQFDLTLPRHSMVMQPSMAELFEKISIDPMLCKLLKLNLGELAKSIIINSSSSSSSSSSDGRIAASKAVKLEKLPLRFMHEEHYIELFQPLLLEEFKAAAMSHLSSLQSSSSSSSSSQHSNNHDATSSFRSKKGKGVSSGQVMKGRCILATSRVGCSKLTEVHMQTVSNDGKGGGRNADGTIMHGRSYQSNVLFKDELVLVFSKPLPDGEVSVMALLQRPHALAIVTTSPSKANPNQPRDNNYNYNNNLSNTYSNNNNNNNNNNSSSSSAYIPRQHTLLMLTTQAPIEDLSMWCVTFMSITTHIREWSALMSIRSDRLMPLAPYLLKASPVVSSVSLSSLHDTISLKLRGLNESHDMAISISTDRRDRLNAALLSDLKLVQLVQVDGSVLKNTGIGKTMQKIITNKSGSIAATCVEVADGLVSKWKEQIKADYKVSTLSNMKGGRVIKMPDTIEDITQPKGMSHHLWSQLKQSYNISQLFAIKYISDQFEGGQDTRIALIQGPPGTGKTSTIVGMVASLLSSINVQSSSQSSVRRRLLICAPSNTAIDEILLRLAKGVYDSQGSIRTVRIVRLGDTSEGSTSQSINKLTLDAQIEERLIEDSNWMKLCEAKEGIMCADKEIVALKAIYNRTSAIESKLKTLLRDLSTLKQAKLWAEINVERARSLLRHQILYEADVVGSTLSSSGKKQFLDLALRDDIIFDTCIIDEAAQATEPSCLIPLRLGCRRLVLVGDPRQLPATIHSKESNDAGLGTSLFERLERAEHEVVMLTIQYRMHPEIRLFPSLQFYENLLTDAIEIDRDDQSTVRVALPKSKQIDQSLQQLLRYHNNNNNDDRSAVIQLDPIKFFDIRQSKEHLSGTSYQNDSEVEFIANLLEQILCYLRSYSIAIISPYSSQVRSIKNMMRSNYVISEDQKDRKTRLMEIDVNTIDGFQGREKDIIIFSTVRSDITSNNNHNNSHHHHGHSSIGFVSDERRLNVAITRAKRLLIIVGNSLTLSRDSTWNNLLSSLHNRGYITTVSPTTFNVKNQGEILTQLSSTVPQEVKDRSVRIQTVDCRK